MEQVKEIPLNVLVPAMNENITDSQAAVHMNVGDKIYVFEKTAELLSSVMGRETSCELNEYAFF